MRGCGLELRREQRELLLRPDPRPLVERQRYSKHRLHPRDPIEPPLAPSWTDPPRLRRLDERLVRFPNPLRSLTHQDLVVSGLYRTDARLPEISHLGDRAHLHVVADREPLELHLVAQQRRRYGR